MDRKREKDNLNYEKDGRKQIFEKIVFSSSRYFSVKHGLIKIFINIFVNFFFISVFYILRNVFKNNFLISFLFEFIIIIL